MHTSHIIRTGLGIIVIVKVKLKLNQTKNINIAKLQLCSVEDCIFSFQIKQSFNQINRVNEPIINILTVHSWCLTKILREVLFSTESNKLMHL